MVKRKRTFLKTGLQIKPEETFVSLAGGGHLINGLSEEIDALLIKFVDDIKLES